MKKSQGFTLIEMLAALGAIAVVLPALFASFYIILREQIRANALQEMLNFSTTTSRTLKTFLTSQQRRIIRNICENQDCSTIICQSDQEPTRTSIYIKYVDDADDTTPDTIGIEFILSQQTINLKEKFTDTNIKTTTLQSEKVGVSDLKITCTPSPDNTVLIEINTTTKYKKKIDKVIDNMQMSLITAVKLFRNRPD